MQGHWQFWRVSGPQTSKLADDLGAVCRGETKSNLHFEKTIRESVFLGDSFSRYGLRHHRSKANRDHRGNALNSSACTEIIGGYPQPDQFGRQGAKLIVGMSLAGPLP